jgi:two-component system cell cycle response regulator
VTSAVADDGDAAGALPTAPVDGDRAAALAETIQELETLSRFDHAGLEQRATDAGTAARDRGLTELELRAQLVQADLLRRRGNIAEAGRIGEEISRWATANGSQHLLARSHFILTAVFQELGDLSLALEHAVRAVDLLADDVAPAMRIDHLARLADCLGLNRDQAARDRYAQVLQLAQEFGDIDRLLMVLNNQAYSETLLGDLHAALAACSQLQSLSAQHGIPLHVGRLDTIARTLIGLGRLEAAEAMVVPGLTPEALDASLDGDAGADFLLTVAEVQRLRGRLEDAQDNLDECVRRCDQHGLTSIRVRARREHAELHAARGDFKAAFDEHKLYSHDLMGLQSAERDARARTLQAIYETTEARQQSRRYRELSLRDPLTGLYNRRYVDEQLPHLLIRSTQARQDVTIALLDLDHFKRVNDTCSHEVGDEVLRTVAALLTVPPHAPNATSGTTSFVARMGGEEFLLVTSGTHPATVAYHLEALRQSVAAHPWTRLTGGLPVTISIGATSTRQLRTAQPAELLRRADTHLYRAKKRGRNRVVSDLA